MTSPHHRHVRSASRAALLSMLGAMLVAVGGTSPAHAANAMKPYGLEAHFNDAHRKGVLVSWDPHGDGGTVQWNAVKLINPAGATSKTYRPQANDVYIPYAAFPDTTRRGGVKIRIVAHGWDGSTATGTGYMKTAAQAYRVRTNTPVAAATHANSCIRQGLTAAVIAGGTGTAALGYSYFVPGAGEVTGGAVAAESVGAGATAYIACLIAW